MRVFVFCLALLGCGDPAPEPAIDAGVPDVAWELHMVAGTGPGWRTALTKKELEEQGTLPAMRRFIVAGQSNANRTDMALVDAQITGAFVTAKVSQGATGFSSTHWLSTTDGGPGSMATQLFNALDDHPPQEYRAIVWNQWEADTGPTEYPNYQTWLTNLIAESRDVTWDGLEWIIILANADSEKSVEGLAAIRAAQTAIAAADPKVTILDLDHLNKPTFYDGLHYTLGAGGGVEAMSILCGQRFEAVP